MADHGEPPEIRLRDLRLAKRRKDRRRACFIPVTYKAANRVYSDYVRNISASGAFIETFEPWLPGEHITMRFSFPHQQAPIETGGTVMWTGPKGVGVEFTSPCHQLQEMVDSHWSVRIESFF